MTTGEFIDITTVLRPIFRRHLTIECLMTHGPNLDSQIGLSLIDLS